MKGVSSFQNLSLKVKECLPYNLEAILRNLFEFWMFFITYLVLGASSFLKDKMLHLRESSYRSSLQSQRQTAFIQFYSYIIFMRHCVIDAVFLTLLPCDVL